MNLLILPKLFKIFCDIKTSHPKISINVFDKPTQSRLEELNGKKIIHDFQNVNTFCNYSCKYLGICPYKLSAFRN